MIKVIWSKVIILNDDNVEEHASSEAGIYRLSVKQTDGSYKVFYVGQAEDIKRRLKEHLSENQENECIKNHIEKHNVAFRFAEVAEQRVRDGAERYMYDYYKPECNEVQPSGPPIEINLD